MHKVAVSSPPGRLIRYALIASLTLGPSSATAGPLLDSALHKAATTVFRAQQASAGGSTECLLAANAGTTEGSASVSFRYFGNGMVMPFYAVSKANQSHADPPSELLARYPGALADCFADSYRDSRRRARAQTAFYGSLTTVGIVLAWVVVPALAGGDDFSDYYR